MAQSASNGTDSAPSPLMEILYGQNSPTNAARSGDAGLTAISLTQLLERQAEQTRLLEQQHEQTRLQIAAVAPSTWDKILPALFAMAGALIASAGAYFLQRQRLLFDQRASRQSAGTDAVSEIKNFRSRQLNEFYAPLEALLKQGIVLRDELYNRLQANPMPGTTFTQIPNPLSGSGYSLWVQRAGQNNIPFRLIDEMPYLQAHHVHLMPNVAEIVRINSLIVKLLNKKIGLVLHDSVDLSHKLGIFLAHQSVLEEVFKTVSTTGTTVQLGYSTAFPRGLDKLVNDDCTKLRVELAQWQRVVESWMDDILPVQIPGAAAP
jgi:hypothetical protein